MAFQVIERRRRRASYAQLAGLGLSTALQDRIAKEVANIKTPAQKIVEQAVMEKRFPGGQAQIKAILKATAPKTVAELEQMVKERLAGGVFTQDSNELSDGVMVFDEPCNSENAYYYIWWPDIFYAARRTISTMIKQLPDIQGQQDAFQRGEKYKGEWPDTRAAATWCENMLKAVSIALQATNIDPRFIVFDKNATWCLNGDCSTTYSILDTPPPEDYDHKDWGRRDMLGFGPPAVREWILASGAAIDAVHGGSSDYCARGGAVGAPIPAIYHYGSKGGHGPSYFKAAQQGTHTPDFGRTVFPRGAAPTARDSFIKLVNGTYSKSWLVSASSTDINGEKCSSSYAYGAGGALEHCKRWGQWILDNDYGQIIANAMKFYYAWHVPYFKVRGMSGMTTDEIREASEEAFRGNLHEGVNATLGSGAGFAALTANPIFIVAAGLLLAIAHGLAEIWPYTAEPDAPQPLFLRSFKDPECETLVGDEGGLDEEVRQYEEAKAIAETREVVRELAKAKEEDRDGASATKVPSTITEPLVGTIAAAIGAAAMKLLILKV